MDIDTLIDYLVLDVQVVEQHIPKNHRWDAGSVRLEGKATAFRCALGRLLLIRQGHLHHTSDDAARRADAYLTEIEQEAVSV